ncbi:hypothetical protein AK812_SmicGene36380 [Symbiodinium microadriaticum]|uniref:Uncharacterized protein n=1 Tax=Symbiodinium microadriaticum TaxID=2951 RepID=A0A1Q9CJ15_SYMMI|nr:hypothetical protein AK812_SmicGene36380 [Symbiodinium microadriaticum]
MAMLRRYVQGRRACSAAERAEPHAQRPDQRNFLPVDRRQKEEAPLMRAVRPVLLEFALNFLFGPGSPHSREPLRAAQKSAGATLTLPDSAATRRHSAFSLGAESFEGFWAQRKRRETVTGSELSPTDPPSQPQPQHSSAPPSAQPAARFTRFARRGRLTSLPGLHRTGPPESANLRPRGHSLFLVSIFEERKETESQRDGRGSQEADALPYTDMDGIFKARQVTTPVMSCPAKPGAVCVVTAHPPRAERRRRSLRGRYLQRAVVALDRKGLSPVQAVPELGMCSCDKFKNPDGRRHAWRDSEVMSESYACTAELQSSSNSELRGKNQRALHTGSAAEELRALPYAAFAEKRTGRGRSFWAELRVLARLQLALVLRSSSRLQQSSAVSAFRGPGKACGSLDSLALALFQRTADYAVFHRVSRDVASAGLISHSEDMAESVAED